MPPIYFLHVWWARRPLVASAAAVLGSLLPVWSSELAEVFSSHPELANNEAYHDWYRRLIGIHGDPIAAKKRIAKATEEGIKLGAKAYGYKQKPLCVKSVFWACWFGPVSPAKGVGLGTGPG